MGLECNCIVDKCCHEKELFEKYLKYDQTPMSLEDLLKQATRQPKPTDDLQMFPKEDRDCNMGPMVACTLIFVTIATICLLVFAYQYTK